MLFWRRAPRLDPRRQAVLFRLLICGAVFEALADACRERHAFDLAEEFALEALSTQETLERFSSEASVPVPSATDELRRRAAALVVELLDLPEFLGDASGHVERMRALPEKAIERFSDLSG